MMEKGKSEKGRPNETNHTRYQADNGDEKKKRFVQAVREAEKATLIFNSDMGNVPVMNTNTMNRKFSLALKAKAAVEDGNANGEPKADTVAQLDDTLSMVRSMEYFGKTTKKAKDREYFTIPVKLNYKDKLTRIAAEINLRKLCKVSCTTPYHASLRKFIKTVVDNTKAMAVNEGCWIQARVDTESMSLRISTRKGDVWTNDVENVPLPEAVFNLGRDTQVAGRQNGGEEMQV